MLIMSYSRINGSGLGLSMAAAAHLMGIFLMLNFIDTDTGLHARGWGQGGVLFSCVSVSQNIAW